MLLFDWTNRWIIFVGIQPLKKKLQYFVSKYSNAFEPFKSQNPCCSSSRSCFYKSITNVNIVHTLYLHFMKTPEWIENIKLDLLKFSLTHFPNSYLAQIPLNLVPVLLPLPIFSLFCWTRGEGQGYWTLPHFLVLLSR